MEWAYGIEIGWEWDFREWDMGGKYRCKYLIEIYVMK